MTHREDEDLAVCATNKSVMPLIVEDELTSPLKCNALIEDFEAYKKAVTETINSNIELFKELPPPKNFSSEEAIAFFETEIKKDLEKDHVFEKGVEVSRYAESMFESMEKYFKNIYNLHTAKKNKHCSEMIDLSKLFLNSDLNEMFLKAISTSFLVEDDFIDLYDKRIRKEHITLITYRNNRTKFERLCDKHNHWVHDFTEKIRLIGRYRTKLIWYVDINNSNTVEELFKDKTIKTVVLDNKVLLQLIQTLEQNTSELEQLVTEDLELYCLSTIEKGESVKAITRMMEIINL
jgi:hypothetical protein